jgi:Ca-activated chloride channel family protein
LAAKPEWPRQYNQGVTAYQSNELATASQQFEKSLASPDRELQQRAQYNLGNVYYRQGESQKEQAEQLWQKAIKQYESALALNPQDADAKFNRDFVKMKLEELKKQQQQQKDQQDQQKQDQKKDQQKDQQQQDKDKQQQDKEKQQQQEEQKKKEQEQQKDKGKEQEQEKQQEQQQQQPQPSESDRQEKLQAKAMLDDLRENEQNWNFFPEVQMKDLKDSGEPAKDW